MKKVVTELPIKRFLEDRLSSLTRRIKPLSRRSLVGLHLAAAVLLGVFVYVSSHQGAVSDYPVVPRSVEAEAPAAIDEVASANIAATIAKTSNLTEQVSVGNQADSLTAQVQFATVDTDYLTKPQVVVTDTKTKKDIIVYKTVAGDTISSIAAKFNITSDTIRWSNNVTGDAIAADKELVIPPINGIYYEVKAGDSVESLAVKFNASKEQIVFFNDTELTGIKAGDKIMIPGGSVQPVRVATRSAAATQNFSFGFPFGNAPIYGNNGYTYGYCTWYVANRRTQAGKPIPSNLGNAYSWYSLAQRSGLAVGSAPAVGAVLWHRGGNHVAYVESIGEDGSLFVSEMNAPVWGVRSTRTVPASEIGRYGFIY